MLFGFHFYSFLGFEVVLHLIPLGFFIALNKLKRKLPMMQNIFSIYKVSFQTKE